MTIPSAPAPPASANIAAENPPPGAATPLPTGTFEHYLQTESASDGKVLPAKTKSKEVRPKAAANTIVTQGEQPNPTAPLFPLPPLPIALLPIPGAATDGTNTAQVGEASAPKSAVLEAPESVLRRTIPSAELPLSGQNIPIGTRPTTGESAASQGWNSQSLPPGGNDAMVEPAIESRKPQAPRVVEFAGSTKTEASSPKITPAIPAPGASAAAPPGDIGQNLTSPGEADIYLIPAVEATVEKSRGTGGAKAVREMNETSATTSNAPSGASVDRTTDATLNAQVTGLEDQLPGRGKALSQDSPAAANGGANQGIPDTLAISAIGLPTSFGQMSGASGSEVSASLPMTPAAVLGEVGLGLERIQQNGANRLDLHLPLEGGGQVSIALQMHDGAVHASIVTGSPELRAALQQGWSQLSSRSESLGLSLASPVFKTPPTTATAGQQEFRERREAPSQNQNLVTASSIPTLQPKRPASSTATTLPPSSGWNAWA